MKMQHKRMLNGGFLLGAVVGSNFLNFLFNALLSRWLSFENFGLITLVVTFYYVSTIFTNALVNTLSFSTSTMAKNGEENRAASFFHFIRKKSLRVSIVVCGVWILLIPLLMNFFHVTTVLPFLAFIPVLIGSVYAYATSGYLQGSLRFGEAGSILISEPIIKLIMGITFTVLGFGAFAYFSLPISLLAATIVASFVFRAKPKQAATKTKDTFPFPQHFFITSVVTGIGATIFFSIDIILVKHFFSPELSGQYALVSLIGKMVFFFAILPNLFTLPIVARQKDDSKLRHIFLIVFGSTLLLSFCAWIALSFFSSLIVPLLFGQKSIAILPLLPTYVLGIALYSAASVIISFQVARQQYIYGYSSLIAGVLFSILMFWRHDSLFSVVSNILLTTLLLLGFLLVFHTFYRKKKVSHVNKLPIQTPNPIPPPSLHLRASVQRRKKH